VVALEGRLLHDSYPTLASYWSKWQRYTAIEGRGLRPDALRLVRNVALTPVRLLWLYVVRGGWRDGWRGVIVSLGSSLYPAAAAAKAFLQP
jgi:hypothetical protein